MDSADVLITDNERLLHNVSTGSRQQDRHRQLQLALVHQTSHLLSARSLRRPRHPCPHVVGCRHSVTLHITVGIFLLS